MKPVSHEPWPPSASGVHVVPMPFVGVEVSLPPPLSVMELPSDPEPPSPFPESADPPESVPPPKAVPLLELHEAIASGARPSAKTIDAVAAMCFMARTLLRDWASDEGPFQSPYFSGLSSNGTWDVVQCLAFKSQSTAAARSTNMPSLACDTSRSTSHIDPIGRTVSSAADVPGRARLVENLRERVGARKTHFRNAVDEIPAPLRRFFVLAHRLTLAEGDSIDVDTSVPRHLDEVGDFALTVTKCPLSSSNWISLMLVSRHERLLPALIFVAVIFTTPWPVSSTGICCSARDSVSSVT